MPATPTAMEKTDSALDHRKSPWLYHPPSSTTIAQADPISLPWHQNDPFVRKFPLGQLEAIVGPVSPQPFSQLTDTDILGLGDDTIAIHPILQPILTILSPPSTYLIASLRLATRFLSSPHTLPFFHTLFTGAITILPSESNYYAIPIYSLTPTHYHQNSLSLPDAELVLTTRALTALQPPYVTFQLKPSDTRLEHAWAIAERNNDLNPSHIRLHPELWFGMVGTPAVITLSSSFQTLLQPTSTASTHQKTRAAYFLATYLIHELAHAVLMARLPPSMTVHEPFLLDLNQRQSELGHALEHFLFGGGKLLSLCQDWEFKVGLGWQRWPRTNDFYVQCPCSLRPVALARLVPETGLPRLGPKWETIYAISHSWIERQFSAAFWERLDGRVGGAGLEMFHVPKILGVRRMNADFWPRRGGWSQAYRFGFMEEEFADGCDSLDRGMDDMGVVRLGQPLGQMETRDHEDDESDEEAGDSQSDSEEDDAEKENLSPAISLEMGSPGQENK